MSSAPAQGPAAAVTSADAIRDATSKKVRVLRIKEPPEQALGQTGLRRFSGILSARLKHNIATRSILLRMVNLLLTSNRKVSIGSLDPQELSEFVGLPPLLRASHLNDTTALKPKIWINC